jgi:hypothetical protein
LGSCPEFTCIDAREDNRDNTAATNTLARFTDSSKDSGIGNQESGLGHESGLNPSPSPDT